jgi:hypothetical protein
MPTKPLSPDAGTFDLEVLLGVLSDVNAGDFSARMPVHWTGMGGKAADGFNKLIGANQALGVELERVSRVVGKEGKLSQPRVSPRRSRPLSGAMPGPPSDAGPMLASAPTVREPAPRSRGQHDGLPSGSLETSCHASRKSSRPRRWTNRIV